ncbi:hypothetical protein COCCU_08615 [Corynebacterium occultum]|uniref:TIGR03085 family protein n=1 Tax=Corynebacterium occultum TaxID=2675219 RepID=A0A6B8W6V3_9CORY|nr:TIGR03085 family metal-binding protein [Corynebacterium occultum]QGU07647.1 hypothetical protein COCCU_08615 [Corynebacterium occultum]
MSFSAAERARLAELMLNLGPDAPTLCEGWDTQDLAVHLYIRENVPTGAAGIFLPPFKSLLERAEKKQYARSFEEVVRDWAAGPQGLSPWRLLDGVANTAEHFVHLEDVRRGGGVVEPRDFSERVSSELYGILKMMAKRMLAKSPVPVILLADGQPPLVVADSRGVSESGDDVLRISGAVGELLLWVFGRDAVKVEISGDPEVLGRKAL